MYTDENAAPLTKLMTGDRTLSGYLEAHLNRLGAGDYFALLAYIEMNEAHQRRAFGDAPGRSRFQASRHLSGISDRGSFSRPGSAPKGGPNTGVFLSITCDDAVDPVPGRKYTFGVVKAAQARGDFRVLLERERRALRAHLGADVRAGLAALRKAITAALAP
jgi:transaldolase/glucose-6-phosphate isomerase